MATASVHQNPPRVHPPPNIFVGVPGTRRHSIVEKIPHNPQQPIEPGPDDPRFVPEDKQDVALLLPVYGSASASTWLENRYRIWRSESSTLKTPGVQGYLSSGHYVFCWGPPMCRDNHEEKTRIAREMIDWAAKAKKRLVWCCVDAAYEKVLADLNWSTLSCIQEDVLHPSDVKLDDEKEVRQNVKRAQKESVNVEELRLWEPDYMPDERTKKQIDDGLQAWKDNRKGRQIASASLDAWLDASSRRYYVARTPEKIVGILILTPIAHESYQIKNCIAFPDSPKGTSEVLLYRVIKEMAAEGKESLTFGTSATEELAPVHNLKGWKIRALTKGYHAITHKTHLTQRGQFRAKFDLEPEPLYVCYPKHGFGFSGLTSLMKLLKA